METQDMTTKTNADTASSKTQAKTPTSEYDYVIMTVFGYGGENSDRSFVYTDFAKALNDSHRYLDDGKRVQIKRRHEIVTEWETFNYEPRNR